MVEAESRLSETILGVRELLRGSEGGMGISKQMEEGRKGGREQTALD